MYLNINLTHILKLSHFGSETNRLRNCSWQLQAQFLEWGQFSFNIMFHKNLFLWLKTIVGLDNELSPNGQQSKYPNQYWPIRMTHGCNELWLSIEIYLWERWSYQKRKQNVTLFRKMVIVIFFFNESQMHYICLGYNKICIFILFYLSPFSPLTII